MTQEKKPIELIEIIGEGTDLTKRAQEDDYVFYGKANHLEEVFRDYNLWRQKIKDYIFKHKIESDITSFFFEADSVPKLVGLAKYIFDENKKRELLKNIRIETSKKLDYLRKLGSELSQKISQKKLFKINSSYNH